MCELFWISKFLKKINMAAKYEFRLDVVWQRITHSVILFYLIVRHIYINIYRNTIRAGMCNVTSCNTMIFLGIYLVVYCIACLSWMVYTRLHIKWINSFKIFSPYFCVVLRRPVPLCSIRVLKKRGFMFVVYFTSYICSIWQWQSLDLTWCINSKLWDYLYLDL